MANHVAHGCSYHLRGTVVLHCRGTLSPCVCGDGIGCGADRGASRGRVATQRLSSHRGSASAPTHHSIGVQVNPLPLHEKGVWGQNASIGVWGAECLHRGVGFASPRERARGKRPPLAGSVPRYMKNSFSRSRMTPLQM